MHAVDGVLGCGDGVLGSGETLSNGSAAEDATGAGRVPEGAGVGVEIRCYVGEGKELKGGLDGRVVRGCGSGTEEGWTGHGCDSVVEGC